MSHAHLQFGGLAGLTKPFIVFAEKQWASGVVLLVCTAVAMIAANSRWSGEWLHLWHLPLAMQFGESRMEHSLDHWINDGLMVIFFLLVGLEIKREMMCGELSSFRKALLPIGAAVGGMAVPALIFTLFNYDGRGAHGWGIPTATDIAFALGVMRLVAGRIPPALFVFLTALAIADDLGAVLVIAVFYTSNLNLSALMAAAGLVAALAALNRMRVTAGFPYAILGLLLWAAVLASGIHATIAGVLLALTIPLRPQDPENSTLHRWEHNLHPWSAYAILPIFALANAGVAISGNIGAAFSDPILWGVALGLLVGKPIGITLLSWGLVRSGFAALPAGVTWFQVFAVSILAGIGFTMSLFIGSLAFTDQSMVDIAKLGIMVGSAAAAIVGGVACALASAQKKPALLDQAETHGH